MDNMDRRWYVFQTYSGYEDSVKLDLERRIESLKMQDYIFQVIVPVEKYIDTNKNGEKKEKERKMFPGYVFVEMIVTDDSWFVVRNTPKVTGFLGSSGGGTKPVPLRADEINPILKKIGVIHTTINFKVGDKISIIAGAFAGQSGEVAKIDEEKEQVTILIDMFGRQTPIDVDFVSVENK